MIPSSKYLVIYYALYTVCAMRLTTSIFSLDDFACLFLWCKRASLRMHVHNIYIFGVDKIKLKFNPYSTIFFIFPTCMKEMRHGKENEEREKDEWQHRCISCIANRNVSEACARLAYKHLSNHKSNTEKRVKYDGEERKSVTKLYVRTANTEVDFDNLVWIPLR